jgi:hypothetical protein
MQNELNGQGMATNATALDEQGVLQEALLNEAKDRATGVVLGYRAVKWDAVLEGDVAAVRSLVNACELHEATVRFLAEEELGDVGGKLNRGLERYYAESVVPKLGDPRVVRQLSQLPAGAPVEAGGEAGSDAVSQPSGTMTESEGLAPRSRPQVTIGHTIRMNTGCGHLYVTVNESEDGKPFELFNHMGKAGGCAASQNEAIGRLISYALRCGASMEPLIKQLKGISCHRPAWGEDGKISSCSDAIGKALETYHRSRELREQRGYAGSGAQSTSNGGAQGRDAGAQVADSGGADHAVSLSRQAVSGAVVSFDSATDAALDRSAGLGSPTSEFRLNAVATASNGHGKKTLDMHRVQGACMDCGSQLSFEEGCVKCHSCGFTECG